MVVKAPNIFWHKINFSLFVVRDNKRKQMFFIPLHYVNMHILESISSGQFKWWGRDYPRHLCLCKLARQ